MMKLTYDAENQRADLGRADGLNLETDGGLETAVIISLFTNARAADDDDIVHGSDPNGWWADQYLEPTGRRTGSKLWLLHRAKLTAKTIEQARTYAKEALQWLITDGVASSVTVEVSRLLTTAIVISVDIQRPKKLSERWRGTWEVQLGI